MRRVVALLVLCAGCVHAEGNATSAKVAAAAPSAGVAKKPQPLRMNQISVCENDESRCAPRFVYLWWYIVIHI